MVLLRITHYWKICGVIHSEIKYMDDDKVYGAKPTPDKNPLLSRKINMLYNLLTKQSSLKLNQQRLTEPPTKAPQDVENNTSISNKTQTESQSTTKSSSSLSSSSSSSSETNKITNCDDQSLNDPLKCGEHIDSNDIDNGNDNNDRHTDDINEMQDDETAPFFENVAMRLRLPIPITMKQRLLMLDVGDDFSHIWFPMWRKFLSMKRIHNSFVVSKRIGKALEMSQEHNNPKVFVSHEHQNCIFIGPYGNNDTQKICLFVKHNDHMMLSAIYYKKYNAKYSKKTKGEHKLMDFFYCRLLFK